MIHIDDIPPSVRAAIDDLDLACIADGDEIDEGTLHHMEQYLLDDLAVESPESRPWVQAAIEARPGVWTARLCRAMHEMPETESSILRCGLCMEFANGRKRWRAANLPENTLPGFENTGGAYQLRPPCSKRGLSWLRRQIYRLRDLGRIETRRERIPDCRQARGWDWGTRLYPKENH